MTEQGTFLGDVLIQDGKIKEIGKDIQIGEAEVIDAKGLYVLPGLIDATGKAGKKKGMQK